MSLKNSARKLYNDTFGISKEFDDRLFDLFFDNCRYITEGGAVISMLFELPLTLVTDDGPTDACYIYACATHPSHRGKGYMGRLIKETCKAHGLVILRPAEESLIRFYSELGFIKAQAVSRVGAPTPYIEANADLKALCADETAEGEGFCIMYKGDGFNPNSTLGFAYSMP